MPQEFEENEHIDQHLRKCNYKIPKKRKTEINRNNISLLGDPNSTLAIGAVIDDPGYTRITAEFNDISLLDNKTNVNLCGPSLSSTFTITLSEEKNYEREFGYIQTSERFLERQYEKAIVYSEFHANLLHNQDEVLDSDGVNYPFYSITSSGKVDESQTLTKEIKFLDNPSSETPKKSSKHDLGCLQKYERHQKFYVYLIMRSKLDNGEWKYDVVYSFDWFIYLKWIKVTGENNNIFEYNCGLNERTPTRQLPDWINSNEFYTCNDDQFEYLIYRENSPGRFGIYSHPKSIFEVDQTEPSLKVMKNDILKEENIFINLKTCILNAKKISEGTESAGIEGTNAEGTESADIEGTNAEGTESADIEGTNAEGTESTDLEKFNELVEIIRNKMESVGNENIIWQINYLTALIKIMDLIGSQACESIKCLLSSLNQNMTFIDYKFCNCIRNPVLEKNEASPGVESHGLAKMKFYKIVRNAVIKRIQEGSW